jgi:hypothetical protein
MIVCRDCPLETLSVDLIWLVLPAAVLLFLIPVLLFNALVRRRNRVDTAFGTIDVMLKKRFDLLPHLAATVAGYARHEAEVLEKVTELRGQTARESRTKPSGSKTKSRARSVR